MSTPGNKWTKEYAREYQRNWARQYWRKHPEKYLWKHARNRALRKNLEFSITVEDIKIPEFCPILGFKLGEVGGTNKDRKTCPTIDRKDNSKGYTVENIGIISYRANQLKGDMTIKDIENLLKFLEQNG